MKKVKPMGYYTGARTRVCNLVNKVTKRISHTPKHLINEFFCTTANHEELKKPLYKRNNFKVTTYYNTLSAYLRYL